MAVAPRQFSQHMLTTGCVAIPLSMQLIMLCRAQVASLWVQERGLEKQKSRLGLSRRSTGIQKLPAHPSHSPSLPVLPHAPAASPALPQLAAMPSSSGATAALPAGTAAATAGTAVAPSSSSMPLAVAPRVPPSARFGSASVPYIDRVIALGSRRAPHLAGTRVKIYCSKGGRGIKSRHSASSDLGMDSGTSRRVRQKVEALDLMIWRCECARKVITKGAPIPASSMSGQDPAKPQSPTASGPVPGMIANQVGARLGATQSLPALFHPSSEIGVSTAGGSDVLGTSQCLAPQLPGSSQLHQEQTQLQVEGGSDQVELIHQLPSSAPLLSQEDRALMTNASIHPGSRQQAEIDRLSPGPAQAISNSPSGAGHGKCRAASHSPSPKPAGSRQSSPGSASLAGLIPATTAVTVPAQHQPPYSIISAAKAASQADAAIPVVTSQDAAQTSMPASGAVCAGVRAQHDEDLSIMKHVPPLETHSKLPALKGILRAQSSMRVPATPDSEAAERHAALNREHSSFSKGTAAQESQGDVGVGGLQRKGVLSTSGLLDLAMSGALPAGDLEPDMFAAFFEDSNAFGEEYDPADA